MICPSLHWVWLLDQSERGIFLRATCDLGRAGRNRIVTNRAPSAFFAFSAIVKSITYTFHTGPQSSNPTLTAIIFSRG